MSAVPPVAVTITHHADRVMREALAALEARRQELSAAITYLTSLTAADRRKALTVARPRPKFTRAQRAEISQRMTRYWAKRRKAS